MKPTVALLAMLLTITPPAKASEAGHEFVTSCSYGAIAGTLVGAASLAFTKRPGDNLNHVARGASLGLYAGILLGTYVAFIVPRLGRGNEDLTAIDPPFTLSPIIAGDRVDGVEIGMDVVHF